MSKAADCRRNPYLAYADATEHCRVFPYICSECRLPVLGPSVAHRCERLLCPQCLGGLSRLGFCPKCAERVEMPKVDPLEELTALRAWADRTEAATVEDVWAAIDAGDTARLAELLPRPSTSTTRGTAAPARGEETA